MPIERKNRVFTPGRLIASAFVVVALVVLMWPAATWLQQRELNVQVDEKVDAVYLVAGAKAQDRRVAGLVEWMRPMAGAELPMTILIGSDPLISRWSRKHQRNLTMTEWAVEKMSTANPWTTNHIHLVPGQFSGTDGEMEALGAYLTNHSSITNLALLTSPFHVRRTVRRLRVYLKSDLVVAVVPVSETPRDRRPWIVAIELVKMCRDAIGLSRHPFLSRRLRRQRRHPEPERKKEATPVQAESG